jgi:hypothetical protein
VRGIEKIEGMGGVVREERNERESREREERKDDSKKRFFMLNRLYHVLSFQFQHISGTVLFYCSLILVYL